MHFAAFTDVGESVKDPALYYGNNVVNSLNLLEAMRTHQAKTIIFSSSAAVYGSPQALKISEGHPSDPINPYGETKRIIEKALESYGYAYGLKSCSLRYFNAAGGDPEGKLKNYKAKENNLIPLALRAARDGGQLTVFGADYPTRDGTCIRDYVHVCDLGSAHIAAMEQLWAGAPTSIYNLGNGNGFSVHEVVKAVEAVTGSPLNVVEGERRPGDPAVLVADAARAQETLGWKPRYPSLETMIAHAWKAMNHG
jgi:UDP-glucose 4-epimerase